MTNEELDALKIILALWGAIAAIIGSTLSVLAYFWLEGRRRFERQLSGLRVIALMAESIHAAVRTANVSVLEVKVDWLTLYLDAIMRDAAAYDVLCRLLQLRAEVLVYSVAGGTLVDLTRRSENTRNECRAMLDTHGRKVRRLFFLTGR